MTDKDNETQVETEDEAVETLEAPPAHPMWYPLTNSQRMALTNILLDRVREPHGIQQYIDVVAGVKTTPTQLLSLFMETGHQYVSTACQHGLHDRCRQACKFCQTPCKCEHHLPQVEATGELPEDEPAMTHPQENEDEIEEEVLEDAIDVETEGPGDDPAVD